MFQKFFKNHSNILFATLLVAGAVLFRYIPHPPNMAPVTAVALFAGATFGRRFGLIVPAVILIVSDFLIGFHDTMLFTWGSFLLIGLLGSQLLTEKTKNLKLFGVTLSSSLLFFVITNFGVWFMGSMYPKTLAGLIECYTMGIPFYRNTIIGDVVFTFGIFTSVKLLQYIKSSQFLSLKEITS